MSRTIRIHRVLRASPEKNYRVVAEAEAMCRWPPPFGFIGKMHEFATDPHRPASRARSSAAGSS